MTHKTHDEVFQELCKEFPGLMDYLMDGHLKEVGALIEKVRDLGNALTSADARYDERSAEARLLIVINKKYEDIVRRVGMMMDAEALKDLVDTDLVPCGLPVTVALDLATISRPLIVAHGEKELQLNSNGDATSEEKFDPSIFALHQDKRISDSTMLKMFMGIDPGLAKDETVIVTHPVAPNEVRPGVFIEQVPDNRAIRGAAADHIWANEITGQYLNTSHDSTMHNLKIEANIFLGNFGWTCIDLTLNGSRHDFDLVVVAVELRGAMPVSHPDFVLHMRRASKRILPAAMNLDEVTLVSHKTGKSQMLMPSGEPPPTPTPWHVDGKRVKF